MEIQKVDHSTQAHSWEPNQIKQNINSWEFIVKYITAQLATSHLILTHGTYSNLIKLGGKANIILLPSNQTEIVLFCLLDLIETASLLYYIQVYIFPIYKNISYKSLQT